MTFLEALERRNRCPSDFALQQVWHAHVKLDVELNGQAAVTHHGRVLAASARPWPGVGLIGECACNSSLVFALVDDVVESEHEPATA